MQVRIVRSGEHKTLEYEWLRTTHHFSFGEYHNPERMHFGPMRVFNDDLIQAGRGFDFHQHRDMEIVTYVVSGRLEHRDNFGNRGIVEAGEVQAMSAGTGVFHSEYNNSGTEPLRLLQMWILPERKDLRPSWAQRRFSKQQRQNTLLKVISPEGEISINQDASFFVCSLDSGGVVEHELREGRCAYLYVIEGGIGLDNARLATGDSAEFMHEGRIRITSGETSELILVDMPEWGSLTGH